jgi:pyridoxamine 5'-phosphate oxidase
MAHFAKRNDYGLACLSEEACDSNPIRQFEVWLADAQIADLKEPTAMVLSTAGPAGPSGRVVLLKEVTGNGFVFYTNYDSRKGLEIKTNPNCALTFYWAELERQVRIEGRAETVAREKSEEYFRSRPRISQLGALASRQSAAIASREELEQKVQELGARYLEDIPLPQNWGGYCVRPERIEFWQGRANRLHDRILYHRKGEGEWRRERLSP